MNNEVFENFLKRHGDNEAPRSVPRDLFQLVVFYSRPVMEEIILENEDLAQEILKKTSFFEKGKINYLLKNISRISKELVGNQKFVFPFYSENVFMSPKEAENYIPQFIMELISKEKIPADAVKENQINYDIIQTGVVPLNLATLEKTGEFKI